MAALLSRARSQQTSTLSRALTAWAAPRPPPRPTAHQPRRTMSGSTAALPAGPVFFMDAFVARQWAPGSEASIDPSTCSLAAFCDRLHAAHAGGAGAPLVDGYAPFCKHVFIPNFIPGFKAAAVPITPENEAQLKTGYTRRRPEELAVLGRWFPVTSPAATSRPDAAWLDVILYSREQLAAEAAALPAADREERVDDSSLPVWGVISIKPQDVDSELPMQPITMLRNALGREEGGSGVPLDRAKYEEAVAYWAAHAAVVDG